MSFRLRGLAVSGFVAFLPEHLGSVFCLALRLQSLAVLHLTVVCFCFSRLVSSKPVHHSQLLPHHVREQLRQLRDVSAFDDV